MKRKTLVFLTLLLFFIASFMSISSVKAIEDGYFSVGVSWYAHIYYRSKGTFGRLCGGSLVHSKWALTAAHCMLNADNTFRGNPNDYRIIIGGNNFPRSFPESEIPLEAQEIANDWMDHSVHPNYYYDIAYDVALLRLKSSSSNRPVILADDGETMTGRTAILYSANSGWDETRLKWLPQEIISNQNCLLRYPGVGEQDICVKPDPSVGEAEHGDSGTPLWDTQQQIGVMSRMKQLGLIETQTYIYTRVGYPEIRDWIDETICLSENRNWCDAVGPYAEEIEEVMAEGLFGGISDGSFRYIDRLNPAHRSHASLVASRGVYDYESDDDYRTILPPEPAIQYDLPSGVVGPVKQFPPIFTDLTSDDIWARATGLHFRSGSLSGYSIPGGREFRPGETVGKRHAIYILLGSLLRNIPNEEIEEIFASMPDDFHPFTDEDNLTIRRAAYLGIVDPTTTTFNGNASLTREELAAYTCRTFIDDCIPDAWEEYLEQFGSDPEWLLDDLRDESLADTYSSSIEFLASKDNDWAIPGIELTQDKTIVAYCFNDLAYYSEESYASSRLASLAIEDGASACPINGRVGFRSDYRTTCHSISPTGNHWLGTQEGVVYYNALNDSVQVFNTSNSNLPHNKINAIATNPAIVQQQHNQLRFAVPTNTLLACAGTNLGVACFDGSLWHTYSEADGKVNDLTFSPSGMLWVAENNQLLSFDGNEWITYENLPPTKLRAIAVDQDWLWATTVNGEFGRFDGDTWQSIPGLLEGNIDDMDIVSNTVYLSWNQGVLVYQEDNGFTQIEPQANVNALTHDQAGYLWVALENGGLGIYDPFYSRWVIPLPYETDGTNMIESPDDKIRVVSNLVNVRLRNTSLGEQNVDKPGTPSSKVILTNSDIDMTDMNGLPITFTQSMSIELTISFPPHFAKPGTAEVGYFDSETDRWEMLGSVYSTRDSITIRTNHFSQYAVFAEKWEEQIYLPVIVYNHR